MALALLAAVAALAGLAAASLFFVALEPSSGAAAYLLPACAVVALGAGVSRLAHGWERRFWAEIAVAVVFWGLASAVVAMADRRAVAPTVAAGALFAAAFVVFLAAVERSSRRHGQAGRPGEAARGGAGSTALVFGLFFYFVVIPAAVDPALDAVQRQLSYMLLMLDLYAAGKLARFGVATRAARWQMLYSLLVLMAAGVFFNDLMACLRAAGVVAAAGADLDGLSWSVPTLFLVLAGRLRHHPFPSEESLADCGSRDARIGPREHLLGLALVFPLIHLFFHGGGLLGAASEPLRDAFVLIWLLMFGAMAWGRQRQLESQVGLLSRERLQAEEALAAATPQRREESGHRGQVRRRGRAALGLPEEKVNQAWRSIPDAMLISTVAEGRILEVNDSFLRQFSYERDEVLGKTGVELKLWVEPEDRAMMTRLLRERGAVRNLAFEFTSKAGERRLMLLSGEIVDLEGITCFVMALRDVTELRSLELDPHKIGRDPVRP